MHNMLTDAHKQEHTRTADLTVVLSTPPPAVVETPAEPKVSTVYPGTFL